ncbi:MAG: (2Fe-2S)-binding protein, partial [Gammaproteobacteria bacterium]|nr:(2Fe-2S)-binding protein [Gammaproteobacteria bacterium]
ALQVACQLQRISPEQRDAEAAVWRKDLRQATALRPWLDAVFQPPQSYRLPASDATLVCRCEEVTAGEVKAALAMGCPGPNQVKSFTRCGMGPCQGRQCGLTLTEMTAQALQTSPDAVGHLRLRMPVKPLTFQALANLTAAAEENEAGCEHR